MFKLGGGGGVQGFLLKSRDFCQPVQGSDLSRLASMNGVLGGSPTCACEPGYTGDRW